VNVNTTSALATQSTAGDPTTATRGLFPTTRMIAGNQKAASASNSIIGNYVDKPVRRNH
jgi:hypothetical protein